MAPRTALLRPWQLLLLLVLVPGGAGGADDAWLADEILTQLQELRVALSKIRSEIRELRDRVDSLEARAGSGAVDASAVSIGLGGRPRLGSSQAPVAIVEFTDFECPFCRRHHLRTVPRLKQAFVVTGKVQYVVMDYPLPFHSQARDAAVAARCAGRQDRYWAMYDGLFSRAGPLGQALYRELAGRLELDLERFDACLKDPAVGLEVDRDQERGSALGVQGTPAFFVGTLDGERLINARLISGAQPYDTFAQTIESMLPRE